MYKLLKWNCFSWAWNKILIQLKLTQTCHANNWISLIMKTKDSVKTNFNRLILKTHLLGGKGLHMMVES
jgi:hypothetical protein